MTLDQTPERRVLLTGAAGYIGSWTTRRLLDAGYSVIALDSFLFTDKGLQDLAGHNGLTLVEGDCRDRALLARTADGTTTVIHLAGLVGDPACAVDADLSYDINVRGTVAAAEAARAAGARFVFASSCSVYGVSAEVSDEAAVRAPVSIYARNKCDAEDLLVNMHGDHFAPTILRFATLHGLSPRPRFDLVANLFASRAQRVGKITVFGGDQWRPFVHCADVAEALVRITSASASSVEGETFNVGSDAENYTIAEVARLVAAARPGVDVILSEGVDDERDYRVSFEKIRTRIGFVPERTIRSSVVEMAQWLDEHPEVDVSDSLYSNVLRVREHCDALREALVIRA